MPWQVELRGEAHRRAVGYLGFTVPCSPPRGAAFPGQQRVTRVRPLGSPPSGGLPRRPSTCHGIHAVVPGAVRSAGQTCGPGRSVEQEEGGRGRGSRRKSWGREGGRQGGPRRHLGPGLRSSSRIARSRRALTDAVSSPPGSTARASSRWARHALHCCASSNWPRAMRDSTLAIRLGRLPARALPRR